LGTSIGGWIATALAIAHPSRVERLVLAAPAGIQVDGVPRYDIFANPFEDVLLHLFHDPTRAAQILPTEYGAEVVVRTYRELTTLARLTWNPYFYDRKLQQRLPRLRVPTLIVWGENDTLLPPAHAEAFAALLPGATVTMLPECGHLVPFECGDALAKLTVDFLTASA
jgi:pimeloyl-ACP methyl ester carboxylesterase